MKKILVLVLILLMISTPVFAEGLAVGYLLAGLIFAGAGGALWGLSDGDPVSEAAGIAILGLGGGGCLLLALVIGIAEGFAEAEAPSNGIYLVKAEGKAPSDGISPVSQNDTVSLKAKDSIFDHLLFGTDGRNTYLGVRFSW